MKSITTRQTLLIVLICEMTTKVLFLPSLFVQEAGQDCYFMMIVLFLLDIGLLCIMLFLTKRFPNLTFNQVLVKAFGVPIAKIILLALFLVFFIKTLGIFGTNYVYLNENLYTNFKWYVFCITMPFIIIFVICCGPRAMGRTVEIFFPLILCGILLAGFMGGIKADFSEILPIFGNGIEGIFSVYKYSIWFGDSLILIAFFGDIRIEKGYFKKILLSVIAVQIFLVLFVIIFYCLYGKISINHKNAISDVMKILPANSEIGNFDWALIFIWNIGLILYLCLTSFLTITLFRNFIMGDKKLDKGGLITTLTFIFFSITVVGIIIGFDVSAVIEFVTGPVCYAVLIIQFLIPLLLFVFCFRVKRENLNEKAFAT